MVNPDVVRARGTFTIRRFPSMGARLVAAACRFPPDGVDVPTRLTIAHEGRLQRWTRTFGDHVLETCQSELADGRIAESLGALECTFRLRPTERGVTYEPCPGRLRFLGWRLPLPRWLSPRVEGDMETLNPRHQRIRIRVHAPFVGPVLEYAGEVTWEGDAP